MFLSSRTLRRCLAPSAFAITMTLAVACAKKPAPEGSGQLAPEPSGPAAASAAATPSAEPGSVAPIASAGSKATMAATPTAAASASAVASAASSAAPAAPAASASIVASAASEKRANDELPKPCQDNFGRLGTMSFTDLGGGKVRITSTNNASASCVRVEPTRYQCDWVLDGKPTGTFAAKFDPAHRSVNGSIGKGKMFSCSGSSQR